VKLERYYQETLVNRFLQKRIPASKKGFVLTMHEEQVRFCFLLLILECLITSCDYRVKYVHHGAEKEEVKEVEAANDHSGFRLWSSGPNFDTDLPQDVSGVVGQTAYLTCRVFDRTNSTVSWIRHSDLHILTVGRYTYTADNRYQSIYNPTTDEWILQIKYLQSRDSGMYECQVSTQPVRSFFVRLNILDESPSKLYEEPSYPQLNEQKVAAAEIMGGSEVHVEKGSTLNLTCVVRNAREKPHYLLWYHKNETIDYTSPRGGISVVNSENSSPEITSTLLLYQVLTSIICFIYTRCAMFGFCPNFYFEILDIFGWPHLLKLPTILDFSCETQLLKSIFFSVFYSIFSEHKSQCLLIFLFIL